MRILFISSWFPYPPTNGSKLRVFNLLRQLARHHEVSLLSFAEQAEAPEDSPRLREICHTIDVVPRRPFRPRTLRARAALFSPTPRSIIDTFSPEMSQAIRQTLSRGSYDVVVASQLASAVFASDFGGLPAVFEEIELAGLAEQSTRASGILRRFRYGLTWSKHRRYLARLLRRFSACTVASDAEGGLLSSAVPNHPPLTVIPNCVRLADYADVREAPLQGTLVFAGALSYFPNHDAVRWFLDEVSPVVFAERPDVRVVLTGDPAGVSFPSTRQVQQTGHVEDVRPVIASASVSLVPVRYGGGTRLKILESMALGTPVVSTRKGAEGLDVVSGEHLLLADDPKAFARCVLDLLADRDLRARLAENALRLVAERYEWEIVGPRFEQVVADVARRSVGAGAPR